MSKADAMFDLLNKFPHPAEYPDCVCPPVEAAIADRSMYRALQRAVLPQRKNDCVKYLLSSWLDSLFEQSHVHRLHTGQSLGKGLARRPVLHVQTKWFTTLLKRIHGLAWYRAALIAENSAQ